MRTGYAVLKAFTFALLLLMSALDKMTHFLAWIPQSTIHFGLRVGYWSAIITAAVCLARGIPVIIEGSRLIQEKENASATTHPAGH
jgi:hypothetical protein